MLAAIGDNCMSRILLTANIVIDFDYQAPKKLDKREITDAIAGAVSECSQIEGANVRVMALRAMDGDKPND